MTDGKKAEPSFLDPSFLIAVEKPAQPPDKTELAELASALAGELSDDDEPAPARVQPAAPAPAPAAPVISAPPRSDPGAAAPAVGPPLPLVPLLPNQLSERVAKNVDPASPPQMRMMAARAMAPMGPKDLVPVVYQLMMDADARIAQAARKTFLGFDDRILNAVVTDPLPQQIFDALTRAHIHNAAFIERVMLNRATPDEAFVYIAQHTDDQKLIGVVVDNQERLLRNDDIVRGLNKNPKCLRSDLDRAVDFLVREGVYLDDVAAFEDSFLKLGKADVLRALKDVKISTDLLTEQQRQRAELEGLSPEEAMQLEGVLNDEEVDRVLEGQAAKKDTRRKALANLPVKMQLKLAIQGDHGYALEAVQSSNKVIAGLAIRNPQIREADVVKITKAKSTNEEVIRYICTNGDWTKAYQIKVNLLQHPKTPQSLVARWLPLMRDTDLRNMAKSKQIPQNVAQLAKKVLAARGP